MKPRRSFKLRHRPGDSVFFFFDNRPIKHEIETAHVTINRDQKLIVVYSFAIPHPVMYRREDGSQGVEMHDKLEVSQADCYSSLKLLYEEMTQRYEAGENGQLPTDRDFEELS